MITRSLTRFGFSIILLSSFTAVYAQDSIPVVPPPADSATTCSTKQVCPTDKDFFNHNLSGSRFHFRKLENANFQNAMLMEANFRHAKLINANFTGAHLLAADFEWADLTGADFSKADLSDAKLRFAKLKGAKYDKFTIFPFRFVPQQHGMIQQL